MKSFKQFISEGQSDVLYHGTNIYAAVSILKSGVILASNSKSRYHDGVRGISLTRSFRRAAQYGVVFAFHRTSLTPLNPKDHVNRYGLDYHPNGEEEEKITGAESISVDKYVSGFQIDKTFLYTRQEIIASGWSYAHTGWGPKAKPVVDFLIDHPLYRGSF